MYKCNARAQNLKVLVVDGEKKLTLSIQGMNAAGPERWEREGQHKEGKSGRKGGNLISVKMGHPPIMAFSL